MSMLVSKLAFTYNLTDSGLSLLPIDGLEIDVL